MKHLGDITKIDGHNIPLVDIVTGGSPCQDLSVAGKRAGLDGERSGLFIEQIRIIKEMRDESTKRLRSRGSAFDIRCVQPRYMVWENVCGAFSSNRGEDFRVVLEETARVVDKEAVIYGLEGGARWTPSGCILADGWSIAWRVHDAQFWGVPQRRKRISLVADFAGQSAPEILFERKGLQGDFEQSTETAKGITRTIKNSIRESDTISFQERAGCEGGGKGILIQWERVGTLSTLNNQSVLTKNVTGVDFYNMCEKGNVGRCLATSSGGLNEHIPCVTYKKTSHAKFKGDGQGWEETTINDTLNVFDNGETRTPTLIIGKAIALEHTLKTDMIVRRLTPLECERLQGYPDGWTDIGDWRDSKGKLHKGDADSPRYKALGNSIALPFWEYMAEKMVDQLKKDGVENPTMASLFDGIGGFPLVYSRCGCEPVWASEIEEFPIAVTKIRFPDDEVTDWLTDDSFIGFCSEKVEREKEVKNETHNGRIEDVSILAVKYQNSDDTGQNKRMDK